VGSINRKERRRFERRLDKERRRGKVKRIRYQKQFAAADGQPFTVIDPDVLVQREARNNALAKWDNRATEARAKGLPEPPEASWPAPTIDCNFAQAVIWFMNNIPFSDAVNDDGKPKPPRKLTPEDAGCAYAVIKAFQNTKEGYVEVEDTVYTWLMDIVKIDGIEAFRPLATQAIIKEKLEDLIKEEDKPGKTSK